MPRENADKNCSEQRDAYRVKAIIIKSGPTECHYWATSREEAEKKFGVDPRNNGLEYTIISTTKIEIRN
ncbi:MAG TPA: hypothetical protein VJZ93_01865 [Candidatus Nanoarchaeia archaeon]|nr:hypothetical protein [Candidatus Nanoarchaeia archaeon]